MLVTAVMRLDRDTLAVQVEVEMGHLVITPADRQLKEPISMV